MNKYLMKINMLHVQKCNTSADADLTAPFLSDRSNVLRKKSSRFFVFSCPLLLTLHIWERI